MAESSEDVSEKEEEKMPLPETDAEEAKVESVAPEELVEKVVIEK